MRNFIRTCPAQSLNIIHNQVSTLTETLIFKNQIHIFRPLLCSNYAFIIHTMYQSCRWRFPPWKPLVASIWPAAWPDHLSCNSWLWERSAYQLLSIYDQFRTIISYISTVLQDLVYRPVYVSCHAKVSNFGYSVWSWAGQQAVSSSNVSGKMQALLHKVMMVQYKTPNKNSHLHLVITWLWFSTCEWSGSLPDSGSRERCPWPSAAAPALTVMRSGPGRGTAFISVWHTNTLIRQVSCGRTALGLFCLRKLFMSPPVMSSSRMKRGRMFRLTPMQRTMFSWLNLLHRRQDHKSQVNSTAKDIM